MPQRHRFSITLATALVVGAAGLTVLGCRPEKEPEPAAPPFEKVALTCDPETGTLTADPAEAVIYLPPGRPQGVEWTVTEPEGSDWRWSVRRKTGHPDERGAVNVRKGSIDCRGTDPDRTMKAIAKQEGTWPYEITVIDCSAEATVVDEVPEPTEESPAEAAADPGAAAQEDTAEGGGAEGAEGAADQGMICAVDPAIIIRK